MIKSNAAIIAQFKEEKGIPQEVELYSNFTWYAMGYIVKKGSVCVGHVKLSTRPEKGKHSVQKWYSLFTREQVEERM